MKVIGIDLGTTSIAGILFDTEKRKIIKSITRENSGFLKTKNSWEKIQDPEKNFLIAKDILDNLIADDVCAIGVTGQMHGIVYFDQNGKSVGPHFTWQDERGNLKYKNCTYAKYLKSRSGYGNVTNFYNQINNLVPKNSVGYCAIADYFVMRLCGLKSPLIHSTNAASFGLFNIKKNKFTIKFNSKITNNFDVAGEYKNIPVSVAIGDNQASVLSACDQDSVLLNIGTGGQVSVVTNKFKAQKGLEIRPYFEGKQILVGSSLCGGRSYSLLKDFFKTILSYKEEISDEGVYKIMGNMCRKCKNPTIKADTRFAGTREETSLTGSYKNITVNNFLPSEFVASTLIGMVEELHNFYIKIDEKKANLICTGNAIRKNKNLLKCIENNFNMKPALPKNIEEASFGACLFALVCIKKYNSIKEVQKLIDYIK